MAVRLAFLRSVRVSAFAFASTRKAHVHTLPVTTPRRLLADFKKAVSEDGIRGTQQLFQFMRVCSNGLPEERPAKRVEVAEEMWSIVDGRGMDLGVEFHNMLLNVYKQNRHPFSQPEFLAKMKERGVIPNPGTLMLLLESYCQQGNMDGTKQVLEELKILDVAISERTYAALISGHCETGNLAAATGLLDVMTANGLDPGFATYTALAAGHAFQGEMERVEEILQDMKDQHLYPGMHLYMNIIDSLSRGGHVQHIPKVLELIKDKPMVDDEIVALSQTLAGREEFQATLVLLRFLLQISVHPGINDIFKVGNNLLRHMATSDLPLETLWPVFDELKSMNLPTQHLYDTLVYYFCYQKGRLGAVPEVLRSMYGQGLPVQKHYLYPLFAQSKGDLKIVSQGVQLLQEFKAGINSQALQFIQGSAGDDFPAVFPVMKDTGLLADVNNTFIAVKAMIISKSLRPYLTSFLSVLDSSYIRPGGVSMLILDGVTQNLLTVQELFEILKVLSSWEPTLSRKMLLDKIAERLLHRKEVRQLLFLVENLIKEKVSIVSAKTLRVLLTTLYREGLEAERHSLMQVMDENGIIMSWSDQDMRLLKDFIFTENVPAVLDAFKQLKEEKGMNCNLKTMADVVTLLCSNSDYFPQLPHFLAMVDHTCFPPAMLCSLIINGINTTTPPLQMQDLVEVIRTLQQWEPALSTVELVDRIAYSLSIRKRADELLMLLKSLIQGSIVQVDSSAIRSTFTALLRADMKAELHNFVALLKEQGIPFEKEYEKTSLKAALRKGNDVTATDEVSAAKENRSSKQLYYTIRTMAYSKERFHHLPKLLMKTDQAAIAPGVLCSFIIKGVVNNDIATRDVVEVVRSLESWEPNISRQKLVDSIVFNYYTLGKLEELTALVRSLVEEDVLVLDFRTVRTALHAFEKMKNKPEDVDLLVKKLKQDSFGSVEKDVDFDMLLIDDDVETALQHWDKLQDMGPGFRQYCSISMSKRLCSDPKLFRYVPQFLTLVDQSSLPPGLLCSHIIHSVATSHPPLNMETLLKVMTILQDWNVSREELLLRLVQTLSSQDRVLELLALVKNLIAEDVVPVSMNVVKHVFRDLVRKKMRSEQYNLFELMKAKGMDVDQERLLITAAISVGDVGTAEIAFKTLKRTERADAGDYSMMLYLLCKKKWNESSLMFYREMCEAGIQPNRRASCALINRVLVKDNIEVATEIQRSLQEQGHSLDMLAYNSFIFAHARQGNVDAAKQTLQEIIEDKDLTPSATSVKGLLVAYGVHGDRDGMLQVQDYLKDTSCTQSMFDSQLLTVLQEKNIKPYILSGFPGPGSMEKSGTTQ